MSELLEIWNDKSLDLAREADGGITHVTINVTRDPGRDATRQLAFSPVEDRCEEDCEAAHAEHAHRSEGHAHHHGSDAPVESASSVSSASSGSPDFPDIFGMPDPAFVLVQPTWYPWFEPMPLPHGFWDEAAASTLACGHEHLTSDTDLNSAAAPTWDHANHDGLH